MARVKAGQRETPTYCAAGRELQLIEPAHGSPARGERLPARYLQRSLHHDVTQRRGAKHRRIAITRAHDGDEMFERQGVCPSDVAREQIDALTRHDGPRSVPVTRGQVVGAKLADEQRECIAHLMRELELPLFVEHHDVKSVKRNLLPRFKVVVDKSPMVQLDR